MSIFNMLDPGTTIRLWTVHGTDWSGGRFKSFWLKRNAMYQAYEYAREYIFVELENEITGRRVRLKNNPDRVPMRIPVGPERKVPPQIYCTGSPYGLFSCRTCGTVGTYSIYDGICAACLEIEKGMLL